MNPFRALTRFTRMVFRQYATRIWTLPGSNLDWSAVGDGTGSSTVMAPLLWIAQTFPEAPPALWKPLSNGQKEQVWTHPLLRLLEKPSERFTGPELWMATLFDWNVDGNAYWLKIRDNAGQVRELWWAPHWTIEPCGDKDTFITHYEYRPDGNALAVRPDDVVHFRFGIDANDPRKGYSRLKSVLREVFTDDEAANFTAALLRNMGVPGLVVSPEQGQVLKGDADLVKEYVKEMFTGDKRGEPLVMSGPTRVAQFGFSPEQLLLKDLRRIPEERVSAALSVPAIVAGLGAGLDRSTFTNYSEAREAAYEQNIIPTQRILAEKIRFSLLSDFEKDPSAWRFGFDLSEVRVLREDEDKMVRRVAAAYREGLATRAESRRSLGLPVNPDGSDDVFVMPLNSVLVPVGETPPTAGTGNGANGNTDVRQVATEIMRQMQSE